MIDAKKKLVRYIDLIYFKKKLDEYLDSLEKRGLKTSMTEVEFNNAISNPNSKGILIDIYKGGMYDI